MSEYSLKTIGYIESCFDDKFGTPRQASLVASSWAKITLESWTNPEASLSDLEQFSHIWVLFIFHKNDSKFVKAKVHPPRLEGKKTGVFASRSPHRFNPLGLSAVKLERIEGNTLFVSGVDFITGTPVVDIKPYVPMSDSIATATSSWTKDRSNKILKVTFSALALSQITNQIGSPAIAETDGDINKEARTEKIAWFIQLLTEVIELDPRGQPYKGTTKNPQPYGKSYGMNIEGFNVTFSVEGDLATIDSVEMGFVKVSPKV